MAATKLFVSHSTKEEPATTRLGTLCDLLRQAGYNVLVDDRFIETGSQWREKIHLALAQCQAALVLFDDEALGSKWVLKEATILAWREALERPRFHFLPVRLGGLRSNSLKEGAWSPLALGEIQHVASAEPREIADHVVATLPNELAELTAFDRLVRLVANQLEGVDETLLEQAAGDAFPGQVGSGADWKAKYADLLARRLFEEVPSKGGKGGALHAAVDVLAKLTLDRDIVARVLGVVRPLWVEADAAAMLPAAAERGDDLALFCCVPSLFTDPVAPDYVARGYPGREPLWIWSVEDASDGADFELVRDRMRAAYMADQPAVVLPPEMVDLAIQNLTDPVVVAVPHLLGGDDLADLKAAFPNVTFLMHTPAKKEDGGTLPANCRRITPEMLDNEDFAAFQAKRRADQLLKRRN